MLSESEIVRMALEDGWTSELVEEAVQSLLNTAIERWGPYQRVWALEGHAISKDPRVVEILKDKTVKVEILCRSDRFGLTIGRVSDDLVAWDYLRPIMYQHMVHEMIELYQNTIGSFCAYYR